ncbi:MAG: hypothetical protein AVDCRST_MAG03-3311 [uncultured Rubrobacteraceae bacterium]|uniref:Uncharacterized protein n=1 Tax=uncultured Rubrobacteraceae bacterium TaxID=349277 RepID=A0A6J4Q3H5_9ACTN|nr:MAG: hypothetical protein AVDCRST_MAG03-3311 [uncultured Rubrobacteraceae bacterium]
MEETNTRNGDGRRLVLGFDAGCATCSGLATRIEEAVGGTLEIRSLSDPAMERWRRGVFGEDAPWAPTLVEVSGNNTQAWTGWRMAAHMARILGTATTWRVMQVLGELDAVPVPETSIAAKLAGRLSRAGFLKGVGGALIAASILSGTEALAKGTPLRGWTHPFERVSFRSQERLHGTARREALRSAMASSDVRSIWKGRQLPGENAFAVRHTLGDDTTLTAVSWSTPDGKILVHYAVDRPIGNYSSEATLFEYETGKEIRKEATSINGRRRDVIADTVGSSKSLARGCGCCRWRWGCVSTVAASCVGCGSTCATCIATPAKWACGACLACAFVGCPIGIRRCCRNPCG